MSGPAAINAGDTVQRGGIKAGGNVNTGTEVGNLAQDVGKTIEEELPSLLSVDLWVAF